MGSVAPESITYKLTKISLKTFYPMKIGTYLKVSVSRHLKVSREFPTRLFQQVGKRGEIGALASLELLMIGSWMRWKGCYVVWVERR